MTNKIKTTIQNFFAQCNTIIGKCILRPFLSMFTYKHLKPKPMYKCFFLTSEGIRGRENTTKDLFNMLNPIVEFINKSMTNLDLCFYLITDYSIVDAITRAKQRNVEVRLITDFSSGIVNNKFAKNFYREGIPVYTKDVNPGQTIMHNKFCIRDNNTLLQASMNLTKNTSKGSYDNVMITTDPELVEPFKMYFEQLVFEFEHDNL